MNTGPGIPILNSPRRCSLPGTRNGERCIQAVIFDLYGTLLQFNQRAFLRDLRRELGGPGARIAAEHLRRLLVSSYSDESEMLADWCRLMGVAHPDERQVACCKGVLERHLAAIAPYKDVRTLLSFLRRRGFRLGVLSNTAQAFTSPLRRLGLDQSFDEILYSCDAGMAKPQREFYQEICRRLSCTAEQCLFVGDSLENDYQTPLSLGMLAVHLNASSSGPAHQPKSMGELAWTSFSADARGVRQLLQPGLQLRVDAASYVLTEMDTLADAAQGRYNVVARLSAVDGDNRPQYFYAKRYLDPCSAHVEATAYSIMRNLGLSSIRAGLLAAEEPVLLVSPAMGRLWALETLDEPMAYGAGGHCAAAYLIANADLRPRNTFVVRDGNCAEISVIDLEHCFFDRALNPQGLKDPFSVAEWDALEPEIERRTKHRALSPAAIRRTRRAFVPVDDKSHPLSRSFCEGWMHVYARFKAQASLVQDMLLERIYQDPPLIIGTQSYRRAMARIDVADIRDRIDDDAAEAFERLY